MLKEKTHHDLDSQLRKACAELGRRLRSGESVRAEDLLVEFPLLQGHTDSALEIIYTEFVVRDQLGQHPSAQEWIARFPQWSQDLEELLQVDRILRDDAPRQAATRMATPRSPESDGSTAIDRVATAPSAHGRVGNYEIIEEIGRGGMGVVYKARQLGLDRIVALKMVLSGDFATPHELGRFHTEAEAAARLQHPNIVQVYEIGAHEDLPFISLEYVAGGSLQERLAAGPLAPMLAAEIVERLAQTVQFAHERGVIHRDLKPANVLLAGRGNEQPTSNAHSSSNPSASAAKALDKPNPKITDFGLAKHSMGSHGGDTRSGAMVGTPSYMAPEQAGGSPEPVGPLCDVYALGAILYESVTGRPPFRAATALETIEQVRSVEPVRPRQLVPKLPVELETICLKCLEKDAVRRYATAQHLADDLRRFLAGEPIQARPIGVWSRTVKWAMRRPATAALIGTIAAVVAIGFPTVIGLWVHADHSRAAAEEERNKASAARTAEQAERERTERLLYDHNIALAHHEYLANNTMRAVQLLDRCRADLRNWEWLYLNRICHSEEFALTGVTLPIQTVAYSPDGNRLAAGSGRMNRPDPGEVCIWDTSTGESIFSIQVPRGPVMSLAFHPDGTQLAAANQNSGIRIWQVEDGQEQRFIKRSTALTVTYSPDGRLLAVGCSDGRVLLLTSADGKRVREWKGHERAIFSIAFSPDGSRFATGSWDGSARLWDTADGTELSAFNDLRDVRFVAFSPDGALFSAATYSGMLRIWRVDSGEVAATHETRIRGVSVALSPDGQSIALATGEQGTQIWRSANSRRIRTFPQNSRRVLFSPDGTRVAAAGFDDVVRIWKLSEAPNPNEFVTTDGARIADLQFSPDGRYLAIATGRNNARPSSGRDDKSLRVWDVSEQRVARVCLGHSDWLTSVAFGGHGRRIATGSLDRTVRVWDAQSGELLHTLQDHSAAVTSVAFSDDGRRIVAATSDGTIQWWNAETAETVRSWKGDGPVHCVCFLPSGNALVSAGADCTIRFWDPVSGDAVASFPCLSPVLRFAFRRDGNLLACAGFDGQIRIWELGQSPESSWDLKLVRVFQGHTDSVTGLSFSIDGKRLVSSGVDRSTKIWDVSAGDEIITLQTRSEDNPRIQFSPDGRFLAASSGQSIILWDSDCNRNAN